MSELKNWDDGGVVAKVETLTAALELILEIGHSTPEDEEDAPWAVLSSAINAMIDAAAVGLGKKKPEAGE